MKTIIAICVGNLLFGLLMWGYQWQTGVSRAQMVPVLLITAAAFSVGLFLGIWVARPEHKRATSYRQRAQNAEAAEMLGQIS